MVVNVDAGTDAKIGFLLTLFMVTFTDHISKVHSKRSKNQKTEVPSALSNGRSPWGPITKSCGREQAREGGSGTCPTGTQQTLR